WRCTRLWEGLQPRSGGARIEKASRLKPLLRKPGAAPACRRGFSRDRVGPARKASRLKPLLQRSLARGGLGQRLPLAPFHEGLQKQRQQRHARQQGGGGEGGGGLVVVVQLVD